MSTCSIVQEFKNGDGVTKEFSFSFSYLNPYEVQVSIFDGTSYVLQDIILLSEVVEQNVIDIATNAADIAAIGTPPIASPTTLGVIKVGNNLIISADGTLNATGGGGGGGGQVNTVQAGANITVDSSNVGNPVVSVTTNSFIPYNISSLPALP